MLIFLIFSLTKKNTGILKIANQRATTTADILTILNSILMTFVKIIGKNIIKIKIIINEINPPKNPNPQAKPEILPIFFVSDISERYELQIIKNLIQILYLQL